MLSWKPGSLNLQQLARGEVERGKIPRLSATTALLLQDVTLLAKEVTYSYSMYRRKADEF